MDKVMCPWCGEELDKSRWTAQYKGELVSCQLLCECGSCSPWGEYCDDKKQAIAAAYQAATKRAPNGFISYEELIERIETVLLKRMPESAGIRADITADILDGFIKPA